MSGIFAMHESSYENEMRSFQVEVEVLDKRLKDIKDENKEPREDIARDKLQHLPNIVRRMPNKNLGPDLKGSEDLLLAFPVVGSDPQWGNQTTDNAPFEAVINNTLYQRVH